VPELRDPARVRLYLSSFRMGGCPERLPDLAGGQRAAVIANAMDAQPAEQRREGVEREVVALRSLGFAVEELDLRDHVAGQGAGPAIAGYDLLWVRGGNVFVLRDALARSGADEAIVALLATDSVCYGGYSAGPCVLGPSIAPLAAVDPPSVVETPPGDAPLAEGLGVLDWLYVPHVDSPGHPETEACGRVAARCAAEGIPARAFRDGEVLLVDGDHEETCRHRSP
jgi:dipeptidase E